VASQARTADLFVELKPYRSDQPDCWPEVIEAALFASGRSVYVVPESAAPAGREIKTVLLAWNDTREAARALAGAMPFLERAQEVVVAMVDRDGPADAKGAEPGADIARHLDRHGVEVELRHVPYWDRTSDGLLNEVRQLNADLVVVGARPFPLLRMDYRRRHAAFSDPLPSANADGSLTAFAVRAAVGPPGKKSLCDTPAASRP